jgi:hypothetical protein
VGGILLAQTRLSFRWSRRLLIVCCVAVKMVKLPAVDNVGGRFCRHDTGIREGATRGLGSGDWPMGEKASAGVALLQSADHVSLLVAMCKSESSCCLFYM